MRTQQGIHSYFGNISTTKVIVPYRPAKGTHT